MIDIRNLYRDWIMHTGVHEGIVNYGALIGMFLGGCVCFCINCCTSSCSRKTVSASEDNTTHVTSVTDSFHSDSTCSTSSSSDMSRTFSEWLAKFDATWTRRTYEYDSLGNQRVASEETAKINGSSQKKDSAENTRLLTSTFIITNTDTVHDAADMSQHNQSEVTQYSVPWYYKFFMYLGIALLALVAVAIAYLYIKHKTK